MPNSSTFTPNNFAAIKCPNSCTTIRSINIAITRSAVSILRTHLFLLSFKRFLELVISRVNFLLQFFFERELVVFGECAVFFAGLYFFPRFVARDAHGGERLFELALP